MKPEFSLDIEDDSDRTTKVEIKKDVDDPKDEGHGSGTMDKIREVWQSSGGIWDEKPPKNEKNSLKKPLFFSREPAPKRKHRGFELGSPQSASKKLVLILGAAAVVVLGAVLYVSMGKAQVIIKPKDHAVNLSLKVRVSDKFSSVDFEENRIPGQLFDISRTVESVYPATGERDVAQKARGMITVYNEYSSQPQTLIATTRFQSDNGLIFRALSTVTVPGMNSAGTAGKIDVEVIADKAGDSYNIPAGRFTVPAFKEKGDSARYEKFYAVSAQPMKGGIVGKSKVVTETDFNTAKIDIQAKSTENARKDIQEQSSGLKILSSINPQLADFKSSAQVDEASENITMSSTAVIKAMGFKESDVHQFINQYLQNTGNLVSFPEKLELAYQNPIMTEAGILEFNLSVTGTSYSIVDKSKILEELTGKKEEEIKSLMAAKEDIKTARVILSPFWVTKIPKDPSRVTVEFDYQ
jgi:hypothetical protein